jgi:hypothetical protein
LHFLAGSSPYTVFQWVTFTLRLFFNQAVLKLRQWPNPLMMLLAAAVCAPQIASTQSGSAGSSWTATSQQESPNGNINPTRTTHTHTEENGRIIDKTTLERLGPNGSYVPYSETERESYHVNDTMVRNVERTYGDADGNRTLIQQTQEDSALLPDGEQKRTLTISSPDQEGRLQVVRQELENSRKLSSTVRVTNTTVLTPDLNGRLSASVQTQQRETKSSDGTVQSTKSTLFPDGNGGWKLGELRESTVKPEGAGASRAEENVSRPDANGRLAVVEHKVERQIRDAGEERNTTETYSTNVPGQAGDDHLQLVERETTVRRASGAGENTTRQVEQPNPGNPNGGLQVTEQTIDIVRPGSNGNANQTRTVLSPNAEGRLGQVWVDMGKTSDPAAIQVDIKPPAKPQ